MEENLEASSMDVDMLSTVTDDAVKGSEVDQAVSEERNPGTNTSSDSDSDSDDDDDEDDEARQNLQIQVLETELSQNPSNYDGHVEYIKLLRKMCLIEKLREAREAMNVLFPLTPEMWQEWAKDELSLVNSPEAFPAIEQLYERGVLDYLSISLWCDYISFVKEHDPSACEGSAAGILKVRNLFERALTVAGLHVTEGGRIWDAYIEFELAILHSVDETNNEEKEKQTQRVRNIFHRKLSVPLSDLRSTLIAYKTWEEEKGNTKAISSTDLDGIPSHVVSAYQKALEMYNARSHFEEQISRQDMPETERLQNFMNYLKFEQSFTVPSRVQILYERAIAKFPISSDLWMDYTRYLDKTLKGAKVVRDVYSRASKNCPWVGELWVRYLLSLERGLAFEDISAVFEKSLLCTFSSFEEYLDLFLTRVDGLRRRISPARDAEDVLNFALIRATFQHASNYLSPNLKNTDGLLRLHSYWARLELKLGDDLAAARAVWENLVKISGSMLEVWKSYIEMEIELGHINEARSIYKRCYSKRFPEMGSEDICNSWLRFEREFGSLEELDHAVHKVTPRLEELQFYRSQQNSKGVTGSTEQNQQSNKKREKRKPDNIVPGEHPLAKRQKDTAINSKAESGKDNAQAQKSVESSKAAEVNTKVDIPENKNVGGIKESRPNKTRQYTDQCTAFISNLNATTNDQHLHDFFKDGVVAIRILKDKFTAKSRGLAYVDFSDGEHLAAALAKNKQSLHGKKLSIARSDPKQKRNNSGQISSPRQGMDRASNRGNGSESKGFSRASEAQSSMEEKVQLTGRNTFAVPRNVVRPLGSTNIKRKVDVGEEEKPKSNDEFRKMFLKQ